MDALLRYPKNQRRAVAQEWALRSQAVQQAKQIERGPDTDTLRMRALHDAKGQVLREGCTYTAGGETHWHVRRSLRGCTDQFDIVANGSVVRTCGRRRLSCRFRPANV